MSDTSKTKITTDGLKIRGGSITKMIPIPFIAIWAVVVSSVLTTLSPASSVVLVDAWMASRSSHHRFPLTKGESAVMTRLDAQRKRNGNLGTLAKEGLIDPSSSKNTVRKPKRSSTLSSSSRKSTTLTTTNSSSSNKNNKNNNKEEADASAISPALAEWMKRQESGQETTASATGSISSSGSSLSVVDDSATTFEAFGGDENKEEKEESLFSSFQNIKEGKSTNTRRVKQSQRNQLDEQRQTQIEAAVKALEEALDGTKKNNLEEILQTVQELLALSPPALAKKDAMNARMILAGSSNSKQRYDYRLAWAGSDDAICHIGTGLHKVPLARLQEVFFSCLGKNRIQVLEVIRILGPFPNVRNTLQGNTKLLSLNKMSSSNDNNDVTVMNIVMDRMVDGTGKEIMAGTKDNLRKVDLQLYFADERAMVAVVPPLPSPDGRMLLRTDPLENNGFHVMVFLRETDLDQKLDALRVS